MIYLDHSATSMGKPPQVAAAMAEAVRRCGNPGRGAHPAAMEAAGTVFACRELAGTLFDCQPERVVFTGSCTHGLNMAIRSLVPMGGRVVISGFEHNAVTRPLHSLEAYVHVAGRRLFCPEDTLEQWEAALRTGADAAVFTHASNVFGYILPVTEMAALCRQYGVPFIIDAAQAAGSVPISMDKLGAEYIAMPGHKGLLGPQGTGLLLCRDSVEPLLSGGTGSVSESREMPDFLPDRGEAGTLNVPGIAGLHAGMAWLKRQGMAKLFSREKEMAARCARGLLEKGYFVFSGPNQGGTVSFLGREDVHRTAHRLAERGIAVRAGLHCAPLAHESAGTLRTGTVRVSFGHDAHPGQVRSLLQVL